MKWKNNQYNFVTRISVIIVPGIVAIITGLGIIYEFKTELIVGTISILSMFFGITLNTSIDKYNRETPRINPYEVDNEFILKSDFPEYKE